MAASKLAPVTYSPDCRRRRLTLAERLAANEADRVRLHREAAERLQHQHR